VRYFTAVFLTLVVNVVAAQSLPPEFEVASIKRNMSADFANPFQLLPSGEIRVTNTPVRNLLLRAYPLPTLPIQVFGLPGWAEIQGERYDVVAKARPGASAEELQQMWRALFADRMKLAAHYETREQSGYRLVRSGSTLGAGLKPSSIDCASQTEIPRPQPGADQKTWAMSHCGTFSIDRDQTMYSGGATMEALIRMMTPAAGRQITDATGLSGYYAVAFRFQRIPSRSAAEPSPDDPPALLTAVQEQLGLKLEPVMVDAQVLVIDHIERPSEN